MQIILVALGGFFGSILRFLIGEWITLENGFPIGTLFINITGCFILGWFLTYASINNSKRIYILLFGTGFLGSFTTFSTFSFESVQLIQQNQLRLSLIYIFLSIICGIVFAYLGYRLGANTSHKKRGGEA